METRKVQLKVAELRSRFSDYTKPPPPTPPPAVPCGSSAAPLPMGGVTGVLLLVEDFSLQTHSGQTLNL